MKSSINGSEPGFCTVQRLLRTTWPPEAQPNAALCANPAPRFSRQGCRQGERRVFTCRPAFHYLVQMIEREGPRPASDRPAPLRRKTAMRARRSHAPPFAPASGAIRQQQWAGWPGPSAHTPFSGSMMASRRTVCRAFRPAPGSKLCNRVLQEVRRPHAAPNAQWWRGDYPCWRL